MTDPLPPAGVVAGRMPELLDELTQLRHLDFSDKEARVATFIDGMFDLGRVLETIPTLRDTPDVRLFLSEAARLLPWGIAAVFPYVDETEHRLSGTWEGDEGAGVCVRRSAIAFLVDLVLGGPESTLGASVETDELDERIRERGAAEGLVHVSKIPEGIPATHWWWWWPFLPPAHGQTLSTARADPEYRAPWWPA
jgi:hypothetical protein